jgi:pimeloyl-ACP methyl ester carboxylesterase
MRIHIKSLSRAFASAAVLLLAHATLSTAQDVPAVFIHGVLSDGSTWAAAADRLRTLYPLAPTLRPSLAWRTSFEDQASQLQYLLDTYAGPLPASTIAIGHSAGGLVARQWSKSHPLHGVVTLGTPNQGAPIAYNAFDWINFNFVAGNVIAQPLNAFARNCCTWDWVLYQGVGSWINWATYWLSVQYGGFLSHLGMDFGSQMMIEVANYSPYMSDLNSPANLAREAASIPGRAAIVVKAYNFYCGGPFRLVWPEYGDAFCVGEGVTSSAFLYWANYLTATADPTDGAAIDIAGTLYTASSIVDEIDSMWCHAVSWPQGIYCTENDTFIPLWAQVWPNMPAIYSPHVGPAHTQETNGSDDMLHFALTNFLNIPPRGSSCSGSNVLCPNEVLDAGASRTSSDGRFYLTYQSDGNLVLYATWDWHPMWSSGTFSSPGNAAMQGDGNFVVYSGDGTPLWNSGTPGHSGANLAVQNDGNVVVYGPDGTPLWATWTNWY